MSLVSNVSVQYIGDWVEGKKHGSGELHYVNGDIFRGDWKGDFATGLGVLQYSNGDVYNGQVGGPKFE